eukprot:CAMPEP_0172930708 /NCGR_PEP_ID=MMETSP1075-20121228/219126_1 /TAXON_ID=2916 /ORGANISM="Ceratium fusus, Strain PA161109" /LENGTH=247 /DNA_ID=CAMNT_0013792021 /DNA_START=89 /DNA_END=832 /DNA_ORIENTATION=-
MAFSSSSNARFLGEHWSKHLVNNRTFLDTPPGNLQKSLVTDDKSERASSDPTHSASSSTSSDAAASNDFAGLETRLNPLDGKLYTFAEIVFLMDKDGDTGAAINFWKTEMLQKTVTGNAAVHSRTVHNFNSWKTEMHKLHITSLDGKLYTFAEIVFLMDKDGDTGAAINFWKTEMLQKTVTGNAAVHSRTVHNFNSWKTEMHKLHITSPVGTKCKPCKAYLQGECRSGDTCGLCHDASHRKRCLMSL